IHGEVFKARPEVISVVHSHSHTVVPFSVTGVPLRPIFHMAAFVGEGLPNYEIRDFQKGTDLLVKTPFLGQALAKTRGKAPAARRGGRGATIVGENRGGAVGGSIYPKTSARRQLNAMPPAGPGGKTTYSDDAEAQAWTRVKNYNRAWPAWREKALARLKK